MNENNGASKKNVVDSQNLYLRNVKTFSTEALFPSTINVSLQNSGCEYHNFGYVLELLE